MQLTWSEFIFISHSGVYMLQLKKTVLLMILIKVSDFGMCADAHILLSF